MTPTDHEFHGFDAAPSQRGDGFAFRDPLPAVYGAAEEPAVLLGVYRGVPFGVSPEGAFMAGAWSLWRVKFPPDGPYRLLLGWAQKGFK